jgi:hypothetical protein
MSDTPLTDGYAIMACDVDATDYVVPVKLARALERDLNALKSAAIRSGVLERKLRYSRKQLLSRTRKPR